MDLNKVIKDLKRGNNIEKNLSVYGNALAKSYCNLSVYMLAMNLASNYDLIEEDGSHDGDQVRALFGEVVDIIEKVVVDEDLSELHQCIEKVMEIRNKIIERTDALDEYTYILQIYEYLLNRAEYRFKETYPLEDVDAFKDEVMVYIAGNGSAEMMNERIQFVMGELPVRLTLPKFFDMINSCSQCYKGVRNDMAEEYFEHLNMCARPLSLETLDRSYGMLYDTCERMLQLDIENISEEVCREAVAALGDAGKFIADNLAAYLHLIDIVNDLLVMMMTVPYVMEFSEDMKKSVAVVKEIISSEKKGTFMRPDEDIVGLLRYLTERQPVYQGEHMMLEDALYVILNEHKEDIRVLMLEDLYKKLHACVQLSSVTVLNRLKSGQTYFSVEQAWINEKVVETEKHFEEVLKQMGRPFKRAVMALTFACMPVVFDRLDDMADYIVRSIEGCRDEAERAASVDIIRDMMAEA